MEYIAYNQIRELFLRPRPKDAHKGDFGRALIIAGSKGMAGAAILCAKAALRAGAGLVTLSVPDELLQILQTAVPEATCIGRDEASLSQDRLAVYDAIAVGPGLGTSPEVHDILLHIIENYGGRLVFDADALNILADTNITFDEDTIITPHPGEAAKLLGTSVSTIQTRRDAAAAILAEKYGCIAVLKGAGTIVAATSTSLEIYINATGNPGMATGGSGDVLTGVIVSLAAQGIPPLTAARAGVYIHGLAGDQAAAEFGERGLIAGDLPLAIARAIKYLTENPRS
jgi:NAD(P)H-hydrate epimerase